MSRLKSIQIALISFIAGYSLTSICISPDKMFKIHLFIITSLSLWLFGITIIIHIYDK